MRSTRKWIQVAEANFYGPEDLLEGAWDDIQASALAAGTVAGLPAIAASPERALALFEETFFACFASRWPGEAHRIRVGLGLRVRPEDAAQAS